MGGKRTGLARLGVESLEGRDVPASFAPGAVWWPAADLGGAAHVGEDAGEVEKKGGTTKGSGKVTYQDFHFTAKMSKASPML